MVRLYTGPCQTGADNLLLQALDSARSVKLVGEHSSTSLGPNANRSENFFRCGAVEGHFDGSDFVDRESFLVVRVVHEQLDLAIGLFVLPYRLVTVHTVTPIQICFYVKSVNTNRARLPGPGQTASANLEL